MSHRSRLIPVVVVALAALAATATAGERYSASFDKTYPLAADGRVSLENVNGDVTVTAWDRDEVAIHAVKTASSQARLDAVEISVDASSDRVAVKTRYPRTSGVFNTGHAEVAYTLSVPRSARLDGFDLVNGDLKIEGVQGGVGAETVNGEVTLSGVAGNIELSTVNGTQTVTLDTLDASSKVQLESVNGRIDLTLPASGGADIHGETVNGHISNDLGLKVEKHRWVGAELDGSVGGGGALIELSTVNGSMHVQ